MHAWMSTKPGTIFSVTIVTTTSKKREDEGVTHTSATKRDLRGLGEEEDVRSASKMKEHLRRNLPDAGEDPQHRKDEKKCSLHQCKGTGGGRATVDAEGTRGRDDVEGRNQWIHAADARRPIWKTFPPSSKALGFRTLSQKDTQICLLILYVYRSRYKQAYSFFINIGGKATLE